MRKSTWVRAAAIGGGVLFAVLIAGVIAFQDDLFSYAMDPHEPFPTMTPPPPPDYARDAAWAARPANPSSERPAIFFVHPTTYWGGSAWNAAINEPEAARRVDEAAIPSYAGAFAPLGDLWAPRYRQASLYSFLTWRYDALRARALAYGDVRQAFTQFLSEAPADSPLVLVGVEQGGLHVLGLLQDVVVSDSLRSRLAVAYVIDQATPLDLFDGALSAFEPCTERDQTGCIVSWGAVEAEDSNEIRRFRDRSMTWMDDGRLQPTEGRALLCVNPVLGTTAEDFVPRRAHQGGVDASGLDLGVAPAPLTAQTSTQCSDGVLLIDRPDSPSLRAPWSWGRRFKPRTAFLFYVDARQDALRRLGVSAVPQLPEVELNPRAANRLPPLEVIEVEESPINGVDDLRNPDGEDR